jgi:hypothetical protein
MILKRTDSRERTERRFQGALHVVAGLLGWVIPDTDAAVKAASLDDEDFSGELPDELQDPLAVLDRDLQDAARGSENCCEGSSVTFARSSLTQQVEEVGNAE